MTGLYGSGEAIGGALSGPAVGLIAVSLSWRLPFRMIALLGGGSCSNAFALAGIVAVSSAFSVLLRQDRWLVKGLDSLHINSFFQFD